MSKRIRICTIKKAKINFNGIQKDWIFYFSVIMQGWLNNALVISTQIKTLNVNEIK